MTAAAVTKDEEDGKNKVEANTRKIKEQGIEYNKAINVNRWKNRKAEKRIKQINK